MGDFTNEITCACQKLGAKAAPQTFDTHMTFCKARPLSETNENSQGCLSTHALTSQIVKHCKDTNYRKSARRIS